MKSFLRHIGVISIIIVVVVLLLDAIYTAAYQNEAPRNKVQLVANMKESHIDYIFLGSSRTENHIDCELVERLTGKSCINLGIQGGRLNDYRILVRLLKHNNVSFKKLFVQVDYIYNFEGHSPSFIASFMPFLNSNILPQHIIDDLGLPHYYSIPFLRYAANDSKIGFRETFMQYLEKSPSVDLNNGFAPLQGVGNHISGHFPETIANTNEALEDIRQQVDQDKLTLFTAPYCANGNNRNTFMTELKQRFTGLRDYSKLFDKNTEYYVNCGHLNENGANEFTKILTQDILID